MDESKAAMGVALIHHYQKHVSPRKGYCCAHRAVKGGESCSAYGARVLQEKGYRQGIPLLLDRLQACSIVFDEEKSHKPKKPKRDSSVHIGDCSSLKYEARELLPEIGEEIGCCIVFNLLK